MKYLCTFETRLEDANTKYQITNKSLLAMMENCSEKHAEQLGFGLEDVNKNGITWVIVDWKLNVINRPIYGDQIKVYTWISKIENYFSYRNFEVEVDNKIIAKAITKMALIDLKTKSIKIVPSKYKELIMNDNENELMNELPRLEVLEQYDLITKVNIRKSDIDINGHVHNLNYMDFIKETFNINDLDEEYNNVRIIYKKEVTINDDIVIKSKYINKKFHYLIADKNDNIYSIIEYN